MTLQSGMTEAWPPDGERLPPLTWPRDRPAVGRSIYFVTYGNTIPGTDPAVEDEIVVVTKSLGDPTSVTIAGSPCRIRALLGPSASVKATTYACRAVDVRLSRATTTPNGSSSRRLDGRHREVPQQLYGELTDPNKPCQDTTGMPEGEGVDSGCSAATRRGPPPPALSSGESPWRPRL